jgi:serine/threonine protein kinase
MIGTQIANYRIEGKIGEGGMGVVYKAIDVTLERPMALKILAPELNREPELIERFQAEAKAQANLNHTNIATLYNFINVDGNWLIAMEYVEGESLEQLIQRKQVLQYQDALPLFKQALQGIGFAHRFGVIHRDIKPANIMVNRHGIVKVMDFGIAKALGVKRLTRTGTALGTVAYMSPEQIRNQNVDIRSDIYSLGVTLYQMLTAHLPFESDSDFQMQYDHVHTPPPPLSLYYPYVPPGVEAAVLKAVEKDPANRFRSVEEFAAALDQPDVVPAKVSPAAVTTAVTVNLSEQFIVHPAPKVPTPSAPTAKPVAASEPKPEQRTPASKPSLSTLLTPRNRKIAIVAGVVLVAILGFAMWMRQHAKTAVDSSSASANFPQPDAVPNTGSLPVPASELPQANTPAVPASELPGANASDAAQPAADAGADQGTNQPPADGPQIPAGTTVAAHLASGFNSDSVQVGQVLPATVIAAVTGSQGNVIVPEGADAQVKVVAINKDTEMPSKTHVRLALVGLSPAGTMMSLSGPSKQVDGPAQTIKVAAKTGFGAFTSKLLHSAGIGSAAGAGAAAAYTVQPPPVRIGAGSTLRFHFTKDVAMSN